MFLVGGVLEQQTRLDETKRAEAGVLYRLTSSAQLEVEYGLRSNNSNIDRYSYTRHRYLLTFEYHRESQMPKMAERLQAARQALQQVGQAYPHARPLARLKQRVRWSMLAALEPSTALRWFERCAHGALAIATRHQPLLVLKPLRPYLSMRWDRPRRMRVIEDSWRRLLDCPPLVRDSGLGSGCGLLAQLTLRSGEQLQLRLRTDLRFRKEGEIVLSVHLGPQRDPLASAALSFEQVCGQWSVYIGCLQGARGSREVYGWLTKMLYGLRPAPLLVFATQELGRALGATRLLAAGRQIQVYRSKHLLHVGAWHGLSRDYDQLWREVGGRLDAEGWFVLPMQTARRARAEQAARKRANYARRHELMDDVASQIRRALQKPIPSDGGEVRRRAVAAG